MTELRPVRSFVLRQGRMSPAQARACEELLPRYGVAVDRPLDWRRIFGRNAPVVLEIGFGMGETTADGLFTLVEVECLGACVNAPILQVNDDYYEDLDGPKTETLLDALRDGKPPPSGSLGGRRGSAPAGGKTTLTEPPEPPPWQSALTEAESPKADEKNNAG